MAKFNIREQDPQKYSAVKAEQDKLSAICGVQMKIARICPYCGHTVSIVYKGDHSYTQEKCSKCGELMMPHRVCKACGSYNKKEIIKVED